MGVSKSRALGVFEAFPSGAAPAVGESWQRRGHNIKASAHGVAPERAG